MWRFSVFTSTDLLFLEKEPSVPSAQALIEQCHKIWRGACYKGMADCRRTNASTSLPGRCVWLSTRELHLMAESLKQAPHSPSPRCSMCLPPANSGHDYPSQVSCLPAHACQRECSGPLPPSPHRHPQFISVNCWMCVVVDGAISIWSTGKKQKNGLW